MKKFYQMKISAPSTFPPIRCADHASWIRGQIDSDLRTGEFVKRFMFIIGSIICGLLLAIGLFQMFGNRPNPTVEPDQVTAPHSDKGPLQANATPDSRPGIDPTGQQPKGRSTDASLPPTDSDVPIEPKTVSNPSPSFTDAVEVLDVAEVNISTRVRARWSEILQLCRDHDDPVTTDILERAREMMRDLIAIRRDPDSFDYAELDQRQRQLISELRQTPAWNDKVAKAAKSIETDLNSHPNLEALGR